MKFLYAVSILLLVTFAAAQESTDKEGYRKCIVGYSVNGRGNFTTETCYRKEAGCQTEIVWNGGMMFTMKMCKEMYACENSQKNNMMNCYHDNSYTNDVHVCTFCCNEDVCNTMDKIPDLDMSRKTKVDAVEGSGQA